MSFYGITADYNGPLKQVKSYIIDYNGPLKKVNAHTDDDGYDVA